MAYQPPHDSIAGINSVQGVMCEVYKAEGQNSHHSKRQQKMVALDFDRA